VSDKKNKADVDYTPRALHHNERCKLCEFFSDFHMLYGECSKVKGNISPLGWCRLFSRKESGSREDKPAE
jgi:hypothetical protein